MSDGIVEADEVDPARIALQIANGRLLASPARASELLDCGLSRVYKMIDSRELPSFLIGGRRKIAITDIAELVAKKRIGELCKRVMPWDARGLGERKYHPRRENPEWVAKVEKPQLRPVGRPPRKVKGLKLKEDKVVSQPPADPWRTLANSWQRFAKTDHHSFIAPRHPRWWHPIRLKIN
jgi:excisionase family DNA binding protein